MSASEFSLNKSSKSRSILLIFLIVLGILLFRRTDAFTNPQIWAEDGPIFLSQYSQFGLKSLLIPYAGYLHFAPRLIAIFWGTLHVSYLYIPICYNYSTFLITFLIVLNIWKTTSYINIKHKILYATSFLLTPTASDIYLNITNINWITALYLVNFLFTRYSDHIQGHSYSNLLAIFIISLTGPFSTLLSPLVILIMILERKELTFKKILPLSLILLGGIIQLVYIKFIDVGFYRGQPGPPEPYHLLMFITNNMSEMLFLKYDFMQWLSPVKMITISFIAFVLVGYFFFLGYIKIANKRKYILLWYAIIVLGVYIKTYWPNESKVLALDNARYYFLPYTCIGWLLILSFDKKIKPVYIGIYLLFFIAQYRYTRMKLADKQWKKQILEYYQGKTQELEINPEGWRFSLPKNK